MLAIFDVEEWERDGFEKLGDRDAVRLSADPLDSENADEYAGAEIVSGFVYSDFSAEILRRLLKLRLIATRSTGFDHIDLHGKTMGIIGTGEIGRETIRIAKGFEMNVVAHDPRPDQEATKRLGFRYVDFDDLLATSDVISIHVPATAKTRHLISRDEFAKMKTGVVLINTARGDVLDTKPLVRALVKQEVAAAGLDVLPEEPVIREEAELLRSVYEERHDLNSLLANHLLVHMRNVIVTPHSAFNTREAVRRIADTTRENIAAFLRGEPANVVSG